MTLPQFSAGLGPRNRSACGLVEGAPHLCRIHARCSDPAALAYLHTALDSIERTVLRGDSVRWATIRDSAALHNAVRALQDAGACAWVVDVRANGGGNMWPMLAGIGPLLGDSIVGSFGVRPSSPRWYYRGGVSGTLDSAGKLETASRVTVSPVQLRDPAAPVAVLFDGGTGSSGAAVVIAFIGRPNSRTFGSRSAGYATVNRGLRLPDGANLVVTTGYNADRRGHVYGEQLISDSTVTLPSGWPSPTDRVTASAIGWLAARASCVHRP